MLYQNLLFNSLFHVAAGFVLCIILWSQGGRQNLLSWWSLVVLLSVIRLGGLFFYRRKQETHSIRFWNLLFGAGSFLIGVLWGMAGVYLTPHEILSYELFVGFVIAGMVVGAVPVLSSVRGVYLAFAFAAEVPYITHIIIHQGEIYMAVAAIHGLFLLLILLMTTRMSTLIRESLLLRFYNMDLVEKLQSSNELLQGEVDSHQQTEVKLRENEQRLSALVNAAFEGIVLHRDGQIVEANHGMAEMTGNAVEDLIGRQVIDLIAEDYRTEVQAYIQAPGERQVEADIHCKDEKICSVEMHAGFVPYGGEQLTYVVVRDISVYKDSLKAKELALQKAEEHDRSKSEFLAAVSHELRTPLNAISGFAQLLEESEQNVEQQQYTRMILQSSSLLLNLINDLLDLSRIESGRYEMNPVAVNLIHEVQGVLETMQIRAAQQGNSLELILNDDLPECLLTDPLRLRQILVNLIGNAIKFTHQGNIVLEVRLHTKPGHLLFLVSDNGLGIPEDKLEYIFGKFNQVDSSISRQHSGTGLGLAICKKLVEIMGGEIGVDSEVDQGTTFWFTLPYEYAASCTGVCQANNKSNEVGFAMNEENQAGNACILLVEDDKTNQMIALAMLKKLGHQISIADNGEQAVELCRAGNQYDLILMDIQMPVMDGISATQKLRQMGISTPIIAMTANAMTGDRETYIKAGMNDYISKPIYKDALYDLIERHLNGGAKAP